MRAKKSFRRPKPAATVGKRGEAVGWAAMIAYRDTNVVFRPRNYRVGLYPWALRYLVVSMKFRNFHLFANSPRFTPGKTE